MRWFAMLLLSACSAYGRLPQVSDPCALWEEPGIYEYETDVDGVHRFAYISVPATEGPRDLVVVLHGGGMTAESIAQSTRYIPLANQEGFVAIFPRGKKQLFVQGWNAGGC